VVLRATPMEVGVEKVAIAATSAPTFRSRGRAGGIARSAVGSGGHPGFGRGALLPTVMASDGSNTISGVARRPGNVRSRWRPVWSAVLLASAARHPGEFDAT
jgi:hypothetical protein